VLGGIFVVHGSNHESSSLCYICFSQQHNHVNDIPLQSLIKHINMVYNISFHVGCGLISNDFYIVYKNQYSTNVGKKRRDARDKCGQKER
jgi:hypothetical protein